MAGITGSRGTGNVLAAQLARDVGKKVSLLEPSENPLTLFSRMAGKEGAVNPQFSWFEDGAEPRFDSVNGAVGGTTATSVVVANGSYFAEHFLVENTRTHEIYRVVAVASNTLTIVRGVGGTTAAAINNADELYIVGVAQPEGDTSRPARSSNPSQISNYTQIFREPVEETGTMLSTATETQPHDWPYQLRKHAIEHAKDIELSLLFGGGGIDTSGSQPRRTTKGAAKFITTNVTDAAGALSETEWNTFMRSMARYGSRNRVAFASSLVLSVLNSFPNGKMQTHVGENTYGVDVKNFISPFGKINVVYHPLLEGAVYGGYLIALDMDEVKYRYLNANGEPRDTAHLTNRQENDRDGKKDEWLTECGLQFGSEKKHGMLVGVTS